MVAKRSGPAVRRSAGALAAALEPPVAYTGVVAGDENVGHGVAAPVKRARVVGVLRSALERVTEGLLNRAVLVAERSGELANDGVHQDHRRRLATREHVWTHGDRVRREVLVHAFVEALVAAAEERE